MSQVIEITFDRAALNRSVVVDGRLERTFRDDRGLNFAAAQGALPVVQRHFVEKARTNRNPFGAPSTFWNRMLAGTVAGADAAQGWVRMPRELALRYHGGTVKPVRAKNLAIPARTEAYGKSPRQFNDLRLVVFGRGGAKALVQNDRSTIKLGRQRKDGTRSRTATTTGGGVMFWLVPMATIRADASVLPTRTALITGATHGVKTFVSTQLGRAS